MSGGTPEERMKAIDVVGDVLHDTGGDVTPAVDALLELGWGPGDAHVHPTREALARALYAAEDSLYPFETPGLWLYVSEFARGRWYRLADALLAADHLWAEEPITAILVKQLAEARALLPLVAERGDAFLYDELSSVLNDGPLDSEGNDIIGAVPVGAPVVDREALARCLYRWATVDEGEPELFDSLSREGQFSFFEKADWIIASGLFVDRVTVEREASAKALDAAGDESVAKWRLSDVPAGQFDSTWNQALKAQASTLAAIATEYREGKR